MTKEHTFYDGAFGLHVNGDDDEIEFVPNLVFVGMPFHSEFKNVRIAIKDECAKLGLNARLVDEVPGAQFVIKKTIELIEQAEFIVFDLSDERPNIYYELGYAHGVGNEGLDVLLVARAGTDIHFNIAPLQVRKYTSTEHLRSIVRANLAEMIRETRK
jgi:hypothetical protein